METPAAVLVMKTAKLALEGQTINVGTKSDTLHDPADFDGFANSRAHAWPGLPHLWGSPLGITSHSAW